MALISNKELLEQTAAIAAELEQRLNQPFYKVFPESGTYARDSYPKHMEFIRASKDNMIVYFRAANRIGKTLLVAWMVAVHMTGLYPSWWDGRRFKGPISVWLFGVDHQQVRDALQKILLEQAFKKGDNGLIPRECLIGKPTSKGKPPGAVLDIRVQHHDSEGRKDGISEATFKCYEQGRENAQGTKQDLIVCDEEPPMDIFTELCMRIMSGEADGEPGQILISATPLKCMTPFIKQFEDDHSEIRKYSHMVTASWDDVPHMSEKEKATLLATMPPHEVEARTKGIPYLGGGMVFPVSPDRYVCKHPSTPFPQHYKYINGLDTGSTTFAVFGAVDPITHTVFVYGEKQFKDVPIPVKAASLRQMSIAPYMADTSLNQIAEYDQRDLKQEYVDCGLIIKHPNKKLKESTISKVINMMLTGQLKISEECRELRQAILVYIRHESGVIRKQDNKGDHPVDAFLYLIQGIPLAMSLNEARLHVSGYDAIIAQTYFDNDEDYDPSDNHWC